MKTNNKPDCSCKCGCGGAGIILGIIFGVITAILFSSGLTPLILNGIWVAFGIGAAALVYLMVLAVINSCSSSCCVVLERCLLKNIKCLLAGTFGTILTTLALVVISLEITSIIVTIIVGLAAFFLIFLIASLISFLKCLICKSL